MSYRVIIIGAKGAAELLGTFEDKGQCRRAWATAKKGAAIATEDGRVLEHKSGTPRGVEGALERFALQLARGAAPAPAPAARPVAAETPKPRPAKRDETRCESCDEPLPGHLTTCPRVAARLATDEADEAPPPCAAKGCEDHRAGVRVDTQPVYAPFCLTHRKLMKDRVRDRKIAPELLAAALREGRELDELGARPVTSRTSPSAAIVVERAPVVDQEFEVNEPIDLSGAVLMPADALRPVSGDTIKRGSMVMLAEPARPDSLGGTDFPEPPPSETSEEESDDEPFSASLFLAESDVLVGALAGGHSLVEVAEALSNISASPAVETPHTPPAPPPTIDEVLSAAEVVFNSYGEWGVTITAEESRLVYCGREQMRVTRKVGIDPLRQLARELAPRADELVTARVKAVEDAERELARERDRLRASEALAARLRSVGA